MAQGTQNLYNTDNGVERAFAAIRTLYELDATTWRILFGSQNLHHVLKNMDPNEVLYLIENREELVCHHVEPGDILCLATDDRKEPIAVVTYIYTDGFFDTFSLQKENYGEAIMHINLGKRYMKTGETMKAIPLFVKE